MGKAKNKANESNLDMWDYIGQALVDSSPGNIFAVNAAASVEKTKARQQPANVAERQDTTRDSLALVSEIYGTVHDSVSSVGSGILGVFGVDAPSSTERELQLLEAQAAAAAGAMLSTPASSPAPVAEDNTLLYVAGGAAALLVVGGIVYAATS